MSFTDPAGIGLFVVGFTVGFGHCIGMCGPIMVSISLNRKGHKVMASHLFYHAGRVITYALLGAALGLTGSFTGLTANIAGLQRGVMIATGIIIMIMGAAMTDSLPCPRIFAAKLAPSAFMSRIFQRLPHTTSPAAHFPIGLMLGLLPCGPVYTALIAAARAGMASAGGLHGAIAGAGIMVSFGMGMGLRF